jgi:hypothetical protein
MKNLFIDERKIIKWMLKKLEMMVWRELKWLRIGLSAGFL